MIEFDAAQAQLLAAARVLPAETIALNAAQGRVLAQDLIAPLAVPAFDNSAMDGYAVRVDDFAAPPARFTLAGRIAAGEATEIELAAGEAVRIFTGAPLPKGANAVAMQEVCALENGQLRIDATLREGMNIRRRGEEIAVGDTALPAGSRLNAPALGLAAALGFEQIRVHRRLRVALLSTGSELVEPGQPLAPGQIYNANRPTLRAALVALGCEVSDLGITPDSFELTRARLQAAAADHDVVISSGGVSVGEEDHVRAAVQSLGALDLWAINIKPGKPFALGRIAKADFIGLPGNPVSCLATFMLLAKPFLLRRQGMDQVSPLRLRLPAAFAWPGKNSRREFPRATLDAEGRAVLLKHQGSAMLTSLVAAEGLVDLAPGQPVNPGDAVTFIPLASLLN